MATVLKKGSKNKINVKLKADIKVALKYATKYSLHILKWVKERYTR
jgi:hypothetical protein